MIIRTSWESGGDTISDRVEITDGLGSLVRINETIPAESVSLAFAMAFLTAKLTCLKLTADADMTLVFALADASTLTVELVAGTPYDWYTGCGFDNPFADDVESLAITSVDGGTLQGWLGVDPT